MRFRKKDYFIFALGVIFLPVMLNVCNLDLCYKISKLKKDVEKLEIETDYLKKEYYSKANYKKIEIMASKMGFEVPKPDTIVMLQNKTEKKEKFNLFAQIFRTENKKS